jgi:hypothetical protein
MYEDGAGTPWFSNWFSNKTQTAVPFTDKETLVKENIATIRKAIERVENFIKKSAEKLLSLKNKPISKSRDINLDRKKFMDQLTESINKSKNYLQMLEKKENDLLQKLDELKDQDNQYIKDNQSWELV